MAGLKILFDTNAFYACEDIRVGRQHANAAVATELKEIALRHDCELFLHPATESDIRRTTNEALKAATLLKFRQWRRLASIRHRSDLATRAAYDAPLSPNDEVDLAMLGALDNRAVDLLITEDTRLRDHAESAGLGSQTLSLLGAVEYLKRLFGQPIYLPDVHPRMSYELNTEDPLFDSLRLDYAGFDQWWAKVSGDHRDCRTIEGPSGRLEALAVLKMEDPGDFDLGRDVLKLCTFKVAAEAEGARRGELVLRSVVQYGREKGATRIYVTAFERYTGLLRLLRDFGFTSLDQRSDLGEMVLVKDLVPAALPGSLSPLNYNKLYGPGAVLVDRAFVVPIQPRWHDILFPEARAQGRILGEEPSGNAMLKAYLCNASTRRLAEGDLLVFYRSEDLRGSTVVGVVESTLVSREPDEIRRFVSTRTVYTDREIVDLCGRGEVLAIRFRQDRALTSPWPLSQLILEGVTNAAPQSIQQVRDEGGIQWLRSQLSDLR